MRITTASGLGNETKRVWIVQRWNDRGGWFDWSICTTLREAEEDYVEELRRDGHDRNARIVRVERVVERESKEVDNARH
jgi:hypothetical protein